MIGFEARCSNCYDVDNQAGQSELMGFFAMTYSGTQSSGELRLALFLAPAIEYWKTVNYLDSLT